MRASASSSVARPSLEAEVFAVAGGVLADEGDLLDAAGDELLRFGDDGFEAARAEFAAQVGNDAEAAGVVAALGDFDVGRGARRGEEARGGFVVEIGGQQDELRPAQSSRRKRPRRSRCVAFGPRPLRGCSRSWSRVLRICRLCACRLAIPAGRTSA